MSKQINSSSQESDKRYVYLVYYFKTDNHNDPTNWVKAICETSETAESYINNDNFDHIELRYIEP